MLEPSSARTVRTTERPWNETRPVSRTSRIVRHVALFCLACVALLAMAGCSGASKASSTTGSSTAGSAAGAHMAGPAAEIHISPATVAAKPKPWVLTTPQSAVRSYLDWTSYADRVGTSDAAKATMGPDEAVRVDSYIQYLLEKSQTIDQTLTSITFGTPSTTASSTLVPAKETWTYRYVSIKTAGKTVGGPYSASYDSTYTVVKQKNGDWIVFSVLAKPKGTVK